MNGKPVIDEDGTVDTQPDEGEPETSTDPAAEEGFPEPEFESEDS